MTNEQIQVKAGKVLASCKTPKQKAAAKEYIRLASKYTQTNVMASHCFNAGAHREYLRMFKSWVN